MIAPLVVAAIAIAGFVLILMITNKVEEMRMHPHYTSTACIHNRHFDCRIVCKYNPAEYCKCQCHKAQVFNQPGKGI